MKPLRDLPRKRELKPLNKQIKWLLIQPISLNPTFTKTERTDRDYKRRDLATNRRGTEGFLTTASPEECSSLRPTKRRETHRNQLR